MGEALGQVLPVWTVIPFAGLLLSIALVPQLLPQVWHSQRNQLLIALGWALPTVAVVLWTDHRSGNTGGAHALGHAVAEYGAFIVLLGSLFVITGGVFLDGDLRARPWVNTAFLGVGAVLANVVGTTGASMLLIRPLLHTNLERRNTWHIPLFFIFVVSNVGGSLTPIGDPPLFLGYLRGVPFTWTLTHLWPQWIFMVSALLTAFFTLDTYMYNREPVERIALDQRATRPLALAGSVNLVLLAGVVASVVWLSPVEGVDDFRRFHAREIAMIALSALSLVLTPASVRGANRFSWGPILEVAALFAGIFVTMVPATALLEARGADLGVTAPWQYFWSAGALSSFLDNAPTYATFAAMACGNFASVCHSAENIGGLAADPAGARVLAAIAAGSVFMGANSYIGNGPNFMVKAIAGESGYPMPSFFAYCGWALLVLGPLYVVVTLVWFV